MKRALINRLRRSRLAPLLADAATFLRSPRIAHAINREIRRIADQAAFIRELPPPVSGAPRLLILSMTNHVYAATLESMLAVAFRARGWSVDVLTASVYTVAHRCFAAFGKHNLIPYETLLANHSFDQAAKDEVARRKNQPADFRAVLEWHYRDAWLGPQLLSSVSRGSFDGAPDPRDPTVFDAIIEKLAQSVRFVHAAEHYLSENKPTLILVNEPNYHVLGPFVDTAIARGVPVIHHTQPSREDALVLKKLTRTNRRIHPNSLVPDLFDRLVSLPWTQDHERRLTAELESRYSGRWRLQARNQAADADQSIEGVRRLLELDPDKPTATVFSHVLWDANLFYGEDIFDNYGHWFVETVKAAAANPNLTWIIKLHPANTWKRSLSGVSGEYEEQRLIREAIGDLPAHVKLLLPDTRVGTLSLFKVTDFGITVRGTTGIELPCLGKPVITAGTGRYSGLGFTTDHNTAQDYLRTLSRLHEHPGLSDTALHRAKVYAHTLFVHRPWEFRSFGVEVAGPVTHPLHQRIVLAAASMKDLSLNGDLDSFADWAIHGNTVDYLDDDLLEVVGR